ncbi:hypothetical protein OUZ56_021656 [Daphnia magna]|uniref:CCHC-type domain-containing protein n=1 Tax=Daphnia magna TaxID=35525 RepID=A0ABR0AUM1_9CRUS|nr:hypothetical protein OUZ56_021656 [Daphnia magna]
MYRTDPDDSIYENQGLYVVPTQTEEAAKPVRPRLVRPVPRYPPNDAAKQRLEFDISPSEASTKTEMADNAALIAALQGFTTAVATDAAARQNQMAQLFQVIGGQQQNQAAMQAIVAAPPNAPVIRPSTVAVNSLPHFSGSADEDAQGFVDQVRRPNGMRKPGRTMLGLSSVHMGIPAPPVTYTAPFNGTACPAPPVVAPPAPNFAAFFQNLGDRLVNQISTSMSRLAVNPIAGGSRAGGPMPQRGPPQRLCYVCNRNGHIARDCPAKNDASTRQRQWRP